MILWKFKETPETRGANMPCSAFRWVIEVEAHALYGSSIGLVHQCQFKSTGEWESSHTLCYMLGLDRKFKFGMNHAYWDGPHCVLSLGWLRIQWENWNCKVCLPDPELDPLEQIAQVELSEVTPVSVLRPEV